MNMIETLEKEEADRLLATRKIPEFQQRPWPLRQRSDQEQSTDLRRQAMVMRTRCGNPSGPKQFGCSSDQLARGAGRVDLSVAAAEPSGEESAKRGSIQEGP
jgi:hypothetical protein